MHDVKLDIFYKFQDPNLKSQIPRKKTLGSWCLEFGAWVFLGI